MKNSHFLLICGDMSIFLGIIKLYFNILVPILSTDLLLLYAVLSSF